MIFLTGVDNGKIAWSTRGYLPKLDREMREAFESGKTISPPTSL
jgi:hypothetical protein